MADQFNALAVFPYGTPVEEARQARDAAIKMMWDRHSMTPEHSEELVDDILRVALPYFQFYPLGDNHHSAAACPYCTIPK